MVYGFFGDKPNKRWLEDLYTFFGDTKKTFCEGHSQNK